VNDALAPPTSARWIPARAAGAADYVCNAPGVRAFPFAEEIYDFVPSRPIKKDKAA